MRLLCTGDVHIGRRSSGTSGREFSCGEAWLRIAKLAAGEEVDGRRIEPVDAVLVAGDLTDADNRYYQGIGPVERGLQRLCESGIPTVAVAGNHDFDTMSDLARALSPTYDFRLLGAGGQWESTVIGDRLRVLGWSYPRTHYPFCPLNDLRPERSDLPTVGLAHLQMASRDDAYAYARPRDYANHSGVSLWVTGHIHVPSIEGPVLNPGSPQAMDFGETGAHGVYLVTLGVKPQVEFLPISTARYHQADVDFGEAPVENRDRLRLGIQRRIFQVRGEIAGEMPGCRHLQLRLKLRGWTTLGREALAAEAKAIVEGDELGLPEMQVQVTRVNLSHLRPAVNLDALAQEVGPIGVVARALRELERGGSTPLAERLTAAVREVAEASYFHEVEGYALPDEEEVRAAAREQGYRMLEALERQHQIVGSLL
jgi:predicted phosphodiesterase